MRIIDDSKMSKKIELKVINNFENKTTEFFNFICELCKKYNMKIYKVVKTYSADRNMGVKLNALNGSVNIFYNSNRKVLEFEIYGENKEQIEDDILKYATTQIYIVGDIIRDEFGNRYILNESVDFSGLSKKISVTSLKDKKEYYIYSSAIVPCIDK